MPARAHAQLERRARAASCVSRVICSSLSQLCQRCAKTAAMRMSHPVLLAASAAALRSAAPRRTPLTLRTASAADAIRDALSFAQRASPATADDRLAHSMRARDLTEDELRAVLVGRGVDEAATADVPRGILADLLGELRAADDARSAAKALGTAPSAPRESLLPSLDATPPPTLRDVVAPDALRQGLRTCLLYTSPSPRDATLSRMPSSA